MGSAGVSINRNFKLCSRVNKCHVFHQITPFAPLVIVQYAHTCVMTKYKFESVRKQCAIPSHTIFSYPENITKTVKCDKLLTKT